LSIQAHGFAGPRRSGVEILTAGFTLIEMMTVIALFAIMLALALPSFNGLIERYRVGARIGALEASLSVARMEAIRRGKNVQLMPEAGCGSAGDQAWTCGWTVQAGTKLLRREQPDVRLIVSATVDVFEFNAYGNLTPWGNILVYPRGNAQSSNAIRLCIGIGGQMRRQSGPGPCVT